MNIVIQRIDYCYKDITTKDCEDKTFLLESRICVYEAYFGHKQRITGTIMLEMGTDLNDTEAIREKIRDMLYTESSPRS